MEEKNYKNENERIKTKKETKMEKNRTRGADRIPLSTRREQHNNKTRKWKKQKGRARKSKKK